MSGSPMAEGETVVPPLALSTMWHQRFPDQDDLRPFLAAAKQMGFAIVELGHGLSSTAVSTVTASHASVAALHHPCPGTVGDDTLLLDAACSAGDHEQQERWSNGVRGTIELAARLGSRAVCVHLGGFGDEALRRLAFEATSRWRARQRETAQFERSLAALRTRLAEFEPLALAALVPTLSEVTEVASRHDVRIGLETGYHPWEAPTAEGMAWLIDKLDERGQVLGAWLDTGHVGARVGLGLEQWREWRDAVAGRWIGVHFHDIVDRRDHLAPGTGSIDFARIGGWLRHDTVRTLEVDWYLEPGELVAGARHLADAGCAHFIAAD